MGSDPAFSQSVAVITSGDSTSSTVGVDVRNGTTLWTTGTGKSALAPAIVSGRSAYVLSDGHVDSYSVTDGRHIWGSSLAASGFPPPYVRDPGMAIGDGALVVPDNGVLTVFR